MKFFIDTASIDDIKQAAALGILDGVTTNPSLMSKEEGTFEEILLTICDIVNGPVNAEVVSTDAEGMIEEGRRLAKLHQKICVKVPIGEEGLKAIKKLSSEGIGINTTLIFSATQALVAMKAGASYVSPFVGRLDDIGHSGMELVEQSVAIIDNYDFPCEVIVASIRSSKHVVEAALMGAHIATMSLDVIRKLTKHPLTDIGLKRFLDDWNSWEQRTIVRPPKLLKHRPLE